MDHRKTPAGKALTLPGWVIVCSALVCLAAAVYLGTLLLGGDGEPAAADGPKTTITSTAPTTTAPTTPAPTKSTPSAKPTKAPTKAPGVDRNIPVAVLNNTTTKGLARNVAAKVAAAGWQVSGTGNWRGLIPETTVYYPAGFEAQAGQLAKDLDFGRIRPAVSPMHSDRLTLILSGPQ